MNAKETNKMVLINVILSVSIAALLLAFFKWAKASLMLGFLIGSALSLVIFLIKDLLSYYWIYKDKKVAISINILIYTAILLVVSAMTIGIIFINKYSASNGTNIYKGNGYQLAFYPINILAFMVGLSMTKISIFIALLFKKKSKRKEA
ncbi:hypothetical protein [Mycoplasmopsis felifaucium]|uniref:Uncharacterized protein n=1 Tax=Mycoplasmopsis felifaucium TaxID=35768 RepID=A0ABZ2RQK1_9BACT